MFPRCNDLIVGLIVGFVSFGGASALASIEVRDSVVRIDLPLGECGDYVFEIDGYVVNSFCERDGSGFLIRLPFSDFENGSRLRVVALANSDVLVEDDIGLEPAREFFDRVEWRGSGQLSTVWKFRSNQRPRPERFNPRDVSVDARHEQSLDLQRDNWTFSVNSEITATDDTNKRLRAPDGPKWDMARGLAALKWQTGTDSLNVMIGDVLLDAGVSLVNKGIGSRGAAASLEVFDGLLEFDAGSVYGESIVGTYKGVVAYDPNNRNSALNATLKPLDGPNLRLELGASLFSSVKPGFENFGVSEVTDGEDNLVHGFSAELGLLEERIKLSTERAFSDYSNPASLNFLNEFGESVDVGTTTGKAEVRRVDIRPFVSGDLSITGHFQNKVVDPLYQSVAAFETADQDSDDYGLSLSWGGFDLMYSKNIFVNNIENVPSILKTKQRSTAISFGVNPGGVGEALGLTEGEGQEPSDWTLVEDLIPSNIVFSRSIQGVEALNGEDVLTLSSLNGSEIPNTRLKANTLSLTWNGSSSSTNVSLSRSFFDTIQLGRETADTITRSANLNHSFSSQNFSFSAGGGLNRSENLDQNFPTESQSASLNLGGSYQVEDGARFEVFVDLGHTETRFLSDGTNSQSNNWGLRGTIDLTAYMVELPHGQKPTLVLSFVTSESDTRDAFSHFSNSNYAITLSSGVSF